MLKIHYPRRRRLGNELSLYKPWEIEMTLCIAAKCNEFEPGKTPAFDNPRVVLCLDMKIETDIAGAETQYKFESLPGPWAALLAGPIPQARELLLLYEAFLRNKTLTAVNALEQLRIPIHQFRRRMAEQHVQSAAAMSYDDFLRHGKDQLPEDLHRQIAYEVSSQQIQAELIIIGFMEPYYSIYLLRGGELCECDHFAAIGTGSTVAEANLYHRNQYFLRPLPETIYSAYEAKRLGEIAPGVGKSTVLIVLYPPKKDGTGYIETKWVSEEKFSILDEHFGKFGPKQIKDLKLPDDFLD